MKHRIALTIAALALVPIAATPASADHGDIYRGPVQTDVRTGGRIGPILGRMDYHVFVGYRVGVNKRHKFFVDPTTLVAQWDTGRLLDLNLDVLGCRLSAFNGMRVTLRFWDFAGHDWEESFDARCRNYGWYETSWSLRNGSKYDPPRLRWYLGSAPRWSIEVRQLMGHGFGDQRRIRRGVFRVLPEIQWPLRQVSGGKRP